MGVLLQTFNKMGYEIKQGLIQRMLSLVKSAVLSIMQLIV